MSEDDFDVLTGSWSAASAPLAVDAGLRGLTRIARRFTAMRRRARPHDRLCIAHGITTAAGNHRGRHYLTTRTCLDRRAVGSHGRPGAILAFLSVGAGDN